VHSLVTGVALFVGFHLLGAGLAVRLAAWADLRPRFLVALTSMATAALAYGVFWIAYLAPRLRSAAVLAVLAASCASLGLAWLRPADRARLFAFEAWLPAVLSGILCVAWLPPLLEGLPINQRVEGRALPSDNILPGLIAYTVVSAPGGALRPLLDVSGDRASERPPLQAAVTVAVGTLVRGTDDEYQMLATLCQAQWAPAILLLCLTAGLGWRSIAFVLVACATSGFFFINTVFTWPKLFAASLMLAAFAIAIERPSARASAGLARLVLAATAGILALLAHPGPAFTLLAVPLCWPLVRPLVHLRFTWKACVLATVVVVAAVAPWVAYQIAIDPPVNRLVREHLGDGRPGGSALSSVLHANLERPIRDHLSARLANLRMQVGNPTVDVWPGSPGRGQFEQFFSYGSALGVLLAGLVAALWKAEPGTGDEAIRRLGVLALVSLGVWSVLVFPAGGAAIHHSSPVTGALLFVAAGHGMSRLPAPLAGVLLAVHAAAATYIWFWPVLFHA
jgi:hypothetical protein